MCDREEDAERLLNGEQSPEAAKRLLVRLCNFFDEKEALLEPKVKEWVIQAFGDILIGIDANEALGLKSGRRGHPDDDKTLAIACFIELEKRRAKRNGQPFIQTKAIRAACTRFSLGNKYDDKETKGIRHHLEKAEDLGFSKDVEAMTDGELDALADYRKNVKGI